MAESNYEYEKYVCDAAALRQTLDTYGVAVIPNVLDEKECDEMVKGIWDFFEHITQGWATPIDRNNTDTWGDFYKMYPIHSMLVQYWGVGHTQASWNVRHNINVVKIFAEFWGCSIEELLVSFDGLSFNLPPETTKRGWNKGNTWYHTDQSFTTNDFKCVQSFITGLDINDYDATLSVYEGSHRFHGEVRDRYNITDKSDWYKLSKEQDVFYQERGCTIKNIK